MKTKITIVALLATFILSSCGQSNNTNTEKTATPETKATNEALNTVLIGYFDVKNALVKDDAEKAKAAAASLASVTGSYAENLNETLTTISATNDIEAQRVAFETLSMNLYDLAKEGGAGLTIYKQYCPMAFDNKGAFWLSDNKEVLNPFFGASMLRCGSVKETIN